jgi:hypothetical protein
MNAPSFSESAPNAKFLMGPIVRIGAKFVAKQAARAAIQNGFGRLRNRNRR